MMVHRLLAHYLAGGKSENQEWYQRQCDHSSGMETRATEAERASIKYKMVEYMQSRIDQEFDGVISGVTEWGIYVELTDSLIEGMVSLRDMTDDMYIYEDKSYRVIGRNHGRTFTLGDRVKIKVLRADLARKLLDFEMVGKYDFHTGKLGVAEKKRH
jgi:ribonuclease R